MAIVSFMVIMSLSSPVFARDLLDAIVGNDGVLHTVCKVAAELGSKPVKIVSEFLGGNHSRDYGYDGYRHGGYQHEEDYGHYHSEENGYGYCHHGLDGNRFSGV